METPGDFLGRAVDPAVPAQPMGQNRRSSSAALWWFAETNRTKKSEREKSFKS
jgi:hypothetical protein